MYLFYLFFIAEASPEMFNIIQILNFFLKLKSCDYFLKPKMKLKNHLPKIIYFMYGNIKSCITSDGKMKL